MTPPKPRAQQDLDDLRIDRRVQFFTRFAGLFVGGVAALVYVLGVFDFIPMQLGEMLGGAGAAVAVVLLKSADDYIKVRDREARRQSIETAIELVREHPEKPQFAWDLARAKLESYLDRNLGQVRSIFWLTLLVMIGGFGIVVYGLLQAFANPTTLPVSIVAAASGVIISFIGGSLLLIYRSILAQSKDYVTVLERINAVGMAMHVIASIPDENIEQKNMSKSELARQLLTLYAQMPVSPPK